MVTPAVESAGFDVEVVDSCGNIYLSLNGYRTVQFREMEDLHLLHTEAAEAHS
jgi:hypothetical protein